VHLELIVLSDGLYNFVHDRVREAAYSLVPEQLRAEAHLRIGRLLAANIAPEKEDEAIFEIVNQLNRGIPLITSREERDRVAELNLNAARRAKVATAYASALLYLTIAGKLLKEDSWDRCYKLAFAIELDRAECEFLTGQLAMAEERLSKLSSRATNLVDMAAATCLQVVLYTTLNRPERAIEICFQYLQTVGIPWSPHPTGEDVKQEFEQMCRQLGSRSIEALLDLPLMSDPDWQATMDVLNEIFPSAFFTDRNLLGLVVVRMVNVSIEHGNSDASCLAYAFLSMVVRSRFGDYDSGFRWGQLSLDLMEKKGLSRFKARVYLCFGNIVTPWVRHLRAGRARAYVREARHCYLRWGAATGTLKPFEKEYFRKNGGCVPVLVGAAIFEGSENEGVAFVLDLSEQKRAEAALYQKEVSLREAQTELAHVSRVTTMGELAASIAHEVNQPLAGIVTNANASLRWLAGDSPNLAEAHEAIRRIIRDGNRASDVILRMRALFKKARTAKERLDINAAIEEVVILTQSEVRRNKVALRCN
jgi:hypothetical protein